MKKILITRYINNELQTLGDINVWNDNFTKRFNNDSFASLELPWLENKRNMSCIPTGIYSGVCIITDNRPYKHIWIKDVPARSDILIHVGNYISDIEGCILPGRAHAPIKGKEYEKMVINSKSAMTELGGFFDEGEEMQIIINEKR